MKINDKVKVRLTEYGESILWYHRMRTTTDFNYETREIELRMWELMQIFGRNCYMGNDQLFVHNEIIISDLPPVEKKKPTGGQTMGPML